MQKHGFFFLFSKIITKITYVSLALLISFPLPLYPLPSAHAQTSSPSASLRSTSSSAQTTKNIVRNFKINLNEYSSFGTDCSQKNRGDANCDTKINEFDLSIWEIEFNSTNPPKRADFNNDGAVNLLDYGLWRNTAFPALSFQQKLESNKLLAWIPKNILNIAPRLFSLITVHAQESGGGEVNSCAPISTTACERPNSCITEYDADGLPSTSCTQREVRCQEFASACDVPTGWIIQGTSQATTQPVSSPAPIQTSSTFTSGGGNSMVINSLTGNNSQQINFNQNGNPTTAAFFNSNGESYAEVAFTNSGSTIIATESNGIPVTVSKTASGPIIENFRNPDGSLLAIKSWPSQASYDAGQPPIAVTIPSRGTTREVLNMQPNGDGIVEKIGAGGNILSRTQLRANGTIVTEDIQNGLVVQSNTEAKFTNLSMKNSIGGTTDYMFYDGNLYAIVQTNGQNTAYIAKPTDQSGSSWTYETLVEGVRREQKTVPDPISEAKSNTPNPHSLIQNINFYKQAQLNPDAITFSEGFTSNVPAIANPVSKANSILAISQAQAPAVLGLSIVKEAQAQAAVNNQSTSNIVEGVAVQVTEFTGSNGQTNMTVSVFGPGATGAAQNQIGTSTVTLTSSVPDVTGMSPTQAMNAVTSAAISGNAQTAPGAQPLSSLPSVPADPQPAAPVVPAPAAPAQPAAPAAPAAPGTGLTESQQALDAGAKAAQNAAGSGASPSQQAKAGYDAAYAKTQEFPGFGQEKAQNLANDVFTHSFLAASLKNAGVEDAAIQGKTGSELASMAQSRGINVTTAVNAARNDQGLPSVSSPFSTQSGQSAPAGPASAPAAAAAAAPGISAPQSGFIGNTGFYSQVSLSTNPNYPPGTYESSIKSGGPEGETVATQIHNPAGGGSQWSDAATGTTYSAHHGSFSGISIGEGQSYGITADGNFAVGTINPETGFVEGTAATPEQIAAHQGAFDIANENHVSAGGTTSGGLLSNMGSCFLPGTLISTPFGSKAIETLIPNDQVYSYNEKTGQKEISNFKELDINFVDEYLVINNEIKTTIYHPFYKIANQQLVTLRADELKIGDLLKSESGIVIQIHSIEKVQSPNTTVYNLSHVSKNNNFFAEGILVHNYGGAGQDFSSDPGSQSYDSWSEGGWSSGSSDAGPGGDGGYGDGGYGDGDYGGGSDGGYGGSDGGYGGE